MSLRAVSFSASGAPQILAERPSRKFNILVVEDEEETRKLVCRILRRLSFGPFVNTMEAKNGAQALSIIEHGAVDVILADWRMPEMSGLDLLKEIRQKTKSKEIPVIMLTAVAQREEVMEAIQAGVTGYILKPFTVQALEEKISAVLKKSQV